MSVVVSNVEVGPWRRELKVEVPREDVDKESRDVIGVFRKQARIPGFRPGKVPASVIQKRFGSEIEDEVQDRLIRRYWPIARDEADLDPILLPRISDVSTGDEGPMSFVATVEVRPDIPLGDVESFDLPDSNVEPADSEVEEAITDIRRRWGKWTTVDREAAQGDLVRGHLQEVGGNSEEEGSVDKGEESEGGEGDDGAPAGHPVSFELGSQGVWEELSVAATGTAAGRSFEFNRQEAGKEGETVVREYRFTVDSVQEQELPEMNDELAAKVGEFETVDDLSEAIRGELRRNKQTERRRAREQALLTQLRERHPMELPAWVVDGEVERLVENYARELARQGVDLEKTEIDWKAIAGQARPDAERRVHNDLVLDAVAEAQGVEVPSSELETFLMMIAQGQRKSPDVVARELAEAGKLEELRAQLRRERTVRHLLGELPGGDVDDGEKAADGDDGADEAAES